MSLDFVHRSAASRVVFRPGALAELPAELERLGVRRPLIVAGSGACRTKPAWRGACATSACRARSLRTLLEEAW